MFFFFPPGTRRDIRRKTVLRLQFSSFLSEKKLHSAVKIQRFAPVPPYALKCLQFCAPSAPVERTRGLFPRNPRNQIVPEGSRCVPEACKHSYGNDIPDFDYNRRTGTFTKHEQRSFLLYTRFFVTGHLQNESIQKRPKALGVQLQPVGFDEFRLWET